MDQGDRPDTASNTRFVESPRGYSHSSSLGLPPELLAKARGRLRRFALLMFCIGVVGTTILFVVHWIMPAPAQGKFIYVFQIVSTLLGGLLYLVARSDRFSNATVLHFGLGYEVLACLLISRGVPYHFLTSVGQFPHLTFASVLIVLYPLIVPSRPRVTLLISLLSAGTVPLGVWVVGLLLGTAMPAQAYVGSFFFPLLCSIIAYFSSKVVHNMNIEVARAQRMGSYILEERPGAGGFCGIHF